MPPKVPKKIPPWVNTFSEFAKTKERKRDVQQSIDMYSEILTKHWDAFVEKSQGDQSERPAKKRNVDPIKSMGKAMDKVAERVEEVKDNQELLKQYKERMKDVVPDQIKAVLSDVVGGGVSMGSAESPEDLNRIIQQTTESLDVLNQTTQKVLSYANVDRQDAELTVQSLRNMTNSIGELQKSLNV
jgi:hypothetical protein